MKIGHLITSFPKTSETFILDRISCSNDVNRNIGIFSYHKGRKELEHDIVSDYNLKEKTRYFGSKWIILDLAKAIIFSLKDPIENFSIVKEIGFNNERTWIQTILFKETLKKEKNLPNILHAHFASNGKVCANIKSKTKIDFKLITSLYGTSFRNIKDKEQGPCLRILDHFMHQFALRILSPPVESSPVLNRLTGQLAPA